MIKTPNSWHKGIETVWLVLITGIIYWVISPRNTPLNKHVLLAQAMVHGHLYIEPMPDWIEHVTWEGRQYVNQQPGGAFLLVPFVWLWGTVNETYASIIIGSITIGAAYWMAKRNAVWMAVFFAFGTIYAYATIIGDAWQFALVTSAAAELLVAFVLLAEQPNALKLGCAAGIAALFRYESIAAWPIYAWRIHRQLDSFLAAAMPAIAVLLWYNWARFGSPFMTDLNLIAAHDVAANGGVSFSLQYLARNLALVLFAPPKLDTTWPYIHPLMSGCALLWTSPAFISVLRVHEISARTMTLMASAIAVCVPALLFYWNGEVQFGARYYIEAYPFLFALLTIHANETGLDQLDKILIGLSVSFVMFGIWHIRSLGWSY